MCSDINTTVAITRRLVWPTSKKWLNLMIRACVEQWQVQPTGHGQNMTIRNLASNSYAAFPGQSFAQGVLVKGSTQAQEYVITAADKGF